MTASDTTPAVAGARRRPLLRLVGGFGPAFVAAIAYVDPGNVAANITAGAREGYALVWVLVVANAMAALVQYCSARLGLVRITTSNVLMMNRECFILWTLLLMLCR